MAMTLTFKTETLILPYRLLFIDKMMLGFGIRMTANLSSSHTFTKANQAQVREPSWIASFFF